MKKPTPPDTKTKITHTLTLGYDSTLDYILSSFITLLQKAGYTEDEYTIEDLMKQISISYRHVYYDDIDCEATLTISPSREELRRQQQAYATKLAGYKKWYEANKVEIQAKEAAKKERLTQQSALDKQKKIIRLQKELEKLTKA